MITNPPIPPQVNEKNKLDKSDKKINLDPPKQKDLSVEEEYIVTLKRKSDLISFYEDMETLGGTSNVPDREVELSDRRPISRNTHYFLTGYEVEELKKDERVLDIELAEVIRNLKIEFNSSYQVSETFDKTPESVNDIPWSILHCAGDQNQRRKGVFGEGVTEEVTDSVTIFNDGENVDLIIMDDPVPYDHQEFLDPDTNQSRVVQYQWFSELNQYMVDLDTQETDSAWQSFVDANSSTPTPYYTCAEISSYGFSSHGSSMAGLAAGKTMGFARKSNIYSMDVLSSQQQIDFFMAFDYIRAFHQNKKNNSENGKYNPTVVNCSFQVTREVAYLNDFSLISQIVHQGVTYNNPNNGTWDPTWQQDGNGNWSLELGYLSQNFGLSNSEIGTQYFPSLGGSLYYLALPKKYPAVDVDVEDAIEEGVIVICAAGNSGEYNASSEDSNYDNEIKFYSSNADWGVTKFLYAADLIFPSIAGVYSFDNFYHRGISPRSAENAITVGAISNKTDFRKGYFSSYGSKLDFLSPGENLISSDIGTTSNYSIGSGTSQASAVASGIATVFCTNKDSGEVNNARFLDYVKTYGNSGEMDGNLSGGGYADNTSMLNTENLGVSVKNRRVTSSFLSFNDTVKKDSGMIYPRKRNKVTSSVYSLTSSVNPVQEGQSFTITLNTINVDPGTVLSYSLIGDNITTGDFQISLDGVNFQDLVSLDGNFTVDNNGNAVANFLLKNDSISENTENLIFYLNASRKSITIELNDN